MYRVWGRLYLKAVKVMDGFSAENYQKVLSNKDAHKPLFIIQMKPGFLLEKSLCSCMKSADSLFMGWLVFQTSYIVMVQKKKKNEWN